MNKEIPWRRFGIESIVIVVSILLAFSIDAWWDLRNDRSAEQELLTTLGSDMAANLERTELLFEISERRADSLISLLETSEGQLRAMDSGDAEQILRTLSGNANFTPYENAIVSGDLSLLRNAELRSLISEWSGLSEDASEMIPQLADLINNLRVSMGYRALQITRTSEIENFAPQVLSELKTNEIFLTSLLALQRAQDVNDRKISDINDVTKKIIELLEN